jgi:predicted transposase YbfD/YdcC
MTGRGCKASSWSRANAEIDGRITKETRFYITSLVLLANAIGPMIRDHWAVECLHWAMDMVFRDDECRVRGGQLHDAQAHGAELIKKSPGKDSQSLKRETTASIRSTSHRDVRVKGGVRSRGCEVQWRISKTPLAVAASKV